MGNIKQKLEYLKDTKEAIKTAIIEKGGSVADNATFRSLADRVSNIPVGDTEPMVLSGNLDNSCRGKMATRYIDINGDKITSENIISAKYMFDGNTSLTKVPFDINCKSGTTVNITYMFAGCSNLETIKCINGNGSIITCGYTFQDCKNLKNLNITNVLITSMTYLFAGCNNIREINIDNFILSETGSYTFSHTFENCYALRKIPSIIKDIKDPSYSSATSALTTYGFTNCYAIDEIEELPVNTKTATSNMYQNAFNNCGRVKNIKFQVNEDGTAKTAKHKAQTITLSTNTGWVSDKNKILNYNSGITADKEVIDDATYQALKNDQDWFSCDAAYSRYNKTSALETIRTLPDTSAYLSSSGGTNTIKFKGEAGSLTDGGAINTMTEEEIAVATAKGWTVSLV